jgi:thiol-disulfide isomerase/thioredoxin
MLVTKTVAFIFILHTASAGNHADFAVSELKKPLFSDKSYYQALHEARKKKKGLFVYFRRNVCGPCDQMERFIFEEPEVKEFYEKYFVCLKVNCDDDFGASFCGTKRISETPAYLFLNPKDESTIYQDAGLFEKNTMIRLAKAGRDFGALMVEMYGKFETENNLPDDFYDDYVRFLEYRQERALKMKVIRRFMESHTPVQIATPVGWKFLKELTSSTDDKYFEVFSNNIKLFVDNFGASEVKEFAVRIFTLDKEKAILTEDDILFRRALDLYMKTLGVTEPGLSDNEKKLIENGYKTEYYLRVKDYPQYGRFASQCVGDLYANNPRLLFEHALNFALHINEKSYLEKAVSWAAQSILLSPHYENIAVYAMLLHKTGENELALKMTERALTQAQEEGVFDRFKISELQQLLKQLVHQSQQPPAAPGRLRQQRPSDL